MRGIVRGYRVTLFDRRMTCLGLLRPHNDNGITIWLFLALDTLMASESGVRWATTIG